jgi:decaprenylphospho-beta-D-ribofuranose 2-oxidase
MSIPGSAPPDPAQTMWLAGWGGYPAAGRYPVLSPNNAADLGAMVGQGDVIAFGNGRAYGDSALNPRRTLRMAGLGRLLAFDPGSGVVEAEAGVLLGDLIAAMLPRGWFPAVTPGTKFVTLGGMIAADVHGKNHHRDGGMRQTVVWIEVLGPDGTPRRTVPGEALFEWTVGGMGLTGVIRRAGLRLLPVETGWLRQTTIAAPDLGAVMAVLEADDAPYSVAWIDSLASGADLGRGLVHLGAHARLSDLASGMERFPKARTGFAVPVTAPSWAMGRPLVGAVNRLIYRRGLAAPAAALCDWDSFFYPLDRVLRWNRLYGRCGFVQFQCVLPEAAARPGLNALLRASAEGGHPSSLAVLKKMGPEAGPFSFPMQGWTLALDLAMRDGTLALMDRLDAIAIDHGGRFYLAKDARMRAETLTRSDPRVAAFRAMRQNMGLRAAFRSLQSERLEL